MRMLTKDELEGSDVFEFSHAENGDREKHWAESSFYLNWGDNDENSISGLAAYILRVFSEFILISI